MGTMMAIAIGNRNAQFLNSLFFFPQHYSRTSRNIVDLGQTAA
jgi:hypothetical protein